jgi:hypothetical protein
MFMFQVCIKAVVAYEKKTLEVGLTRVRYRVDDDEEQFGCLNSKPKKKRRSCGISAAIYPCGYISNIMMMQSSENLRQISIQVADVLSKDQSIKFVGYDFACGLAKHILKISSAKPEHQAMIGRLRAVNYVVDRFHQGSHSCHKENSCPYKWEAYEELNQVNSQICEQTFRQFKKLYSNLAGCSVRTCYLLYLCIHYHRNLQMENKMLSSQLEVSYSNFRMKQ